MGQNTFGKSDCRILKLTISPEQKDDVLPDFLQVDTSMEIKSSLANIGVGMVQNGCDHSGLTTLKLAVPQKGINGISWFLVC